MCHSVPQMCLWGNLHQKSTQSGVLQTSSGVMGDVKTQASFNRQSSALTQLPTLWTLLQELLSMTSWSGITAHLRHCTQVHNQPWASEPPCSACEGHSLAALCAIGLAARCWACAAAHGERAPHPPVSMTTLKLFWQMRHL